MTTFFCAAPARLGAALAMVFLVLGAFLRASIANLGAEAADLTDEMRAATHEGDANTTRFRTIDADARAIRPVAQALIGAVVTFLGALTARRDAGLIMLVSHETPPERKEREKERHPESSMQG